MIGFKWLRVSRRIVRASLSLILVIGLFLSVSVNILIFFSSTFVEAASSIFSRSFGVRTIFVQQADELAELSVNIDNERRINRELSAEIAETRVATDTIIRRVARRTGVSATREVASMPAEAIPYLGAAVIVGATALEIRDMCNNLQDLAELQSIIDPSSTAAPEVLTVCSIEVPTRTEVVDAISNAPEQAWLAARNALPSIEDIRSIEVSEIDWSAMVQSGWLSTRDTVDGLAASSVEATEWLKRWWNDER